MSAIVRKGCGSYGFPRPASLASPRSPAPCATEPETLWSSAAALLSERPRDNRFDPRELRPKSRNYVVREHDGERAGDVVSWDVLDGQAPWPMTNVQRLGLPQWRKLAESPENRCIPSLTEFCEVTPNKHDLGNGQPPSKGKGEIWFNVVDQPVFAAAGFCQRTAEGNGFTIVTSDLKLVSRRSIPRP